jgi:hypothetical protein
VIVYKVRDPSGRLVAEHVREDTPEGKRMCWRQPHGRWGLNGTRLEELPLYLSEHVQDWDADDLIVITEGEKAAQALFHAGLNALGTVTGAGATPGPKVLEVLRDRRVCLWPDNDAAGRAHMERVARRLRSVACEVLFYTWDEAPVAGDGAEHPAILSCNPTAVDRLLTDLEGAPRYEFYAKRNGLPSTSVEEACSGHKAKIITASELMSMELPPVRWVVPDLIPEGVSILAAKPKMGKSWLAYGLCVAVASGGVALGATPVERAECLYLALEDNERRLRKRLGKLINGSTVPDGLHLALTWPRLDQGGVEALDRWLRDHPDVGLVVVDTLKKIRPRTNGNRSIYEVDYEALEPLVALAAEHGVAILVIHHIRKAGADDPLDEISGSTGLTGGVDGVMVLRRERGRADAFLHVTGRDIEDDVELALQWNAETAAWIIVGDADEYRLSKERLEIMRMLEETGEPMTPTEVAGALDESVNTIKMRMWRMARDGQLTNSGGRYTPSNRNLRNSVTEGGGLGYTVTEVTGNSADAWKLSDSNERLWGK